MIDHRAVLTISQDGKVGCARCPHPVEAHPARAPRPRIRWHLIFKAKNHQWRIFK